MSNGGLVSCLAERGVEVLSCPVGDSEVYAKMGESGAVLGGEQSGHIIFGKLESTGDGIVTALRLAEEMVERDMRASELVRGFSKLPQRLKNVRVRDKSSALGDEGVKAAVRRAEGVLKGGRLVVRASGTENVIRILAEGETESACEEATETVGRALIKFNGE